MKRNEKLFLSRGVFALTLILLALFASCSNGESDNGSDGNKNWQEEIFQKMFQENTKEATFSRHKNYMTEGIPTSEGKDLDFYDHTTYAEKDWFYTEYDYSSDTDSFFYGEYFSSSNSYTSLRNNKDTALYVICYAMSEDEKKARLPDPNASALIDDGRKEGEKLVSVVKNDNGTVTVTTSISINADPDFYDEVPEKWKDAAVEYNFILDNKTLEVKEVSTYVVNGTERIPLYTTKITYDVEPDESCISMKEFAEKYEKKEFSPTNKLTVYYNYGTEKQEKYEFQRDSSFKFDVICRDGYEAFSDKDRLEPISDLNPEVPELTVYMEKTAAFEKKSERRRQSGLNCF